MFEVCHSFKGRPPTENFSTPQKRWSFGSGFVLPSPNDVRVSNMTISKLITIPSLAIITQGEPLGLRQGVVMTFLDIII